jgi:hypothetical protein
MNATETELMVPPDEIGAPKMRASMMAAHNPASPSDVPAKRPVSPSDVPPKRHPVSPSDVPPRSK